MGALLHGTRHLAGHRDTGSQSPALGTFPVVCAAHQRAVPAPPLLSRRHTKVALLQPHLSLQAGCHWPRRPVRLKGSVPALLPPASLRPPKPSSPWCVPPQGGGGGDGDLTIFHKQALASWRQHCYSLSTDAETSSQGGSARAALLSQAFHPDPPAFRSG